MGHLGVVLAALGRSWGGLGVSWGGLGTSWGGLGRSWAALGRSWGGLGRCWVFLLSLLAALGSLLGRSAVHNCCALPVLAEKGFHKPRVGTDISGPGEAVSAIR